MLGRSLQAGRGGEEVGKSGAQVAGEVPADRGNRIPSAGSGCHQLVVGELGEHPLRKLAQGARDNRSQAVTAPQAESI
jgi:hypothetical protein